jgi:hypothetical protein
MQRTRNWIWFFLALVALSIVVVVVLGVAKYYVWQQRLTPEELEANRKLWEAKKPRDYDLFYTVRRAGDSEPERIEVRVRDGKTEYVSLNGNRLGVGQHQYYGMSIMFHDLWRFLKVDSEADGREGLHRAAFDPEDGHLLRYDRRGGGQPPLEIVVEKLERARPAAKAGGP